MYYVYSKVNKWCIPSTPPWIRWNKRKRFSFKSVTIKTSLIHYILTAIVSNYRIFVLFVQQGQLVCSCTESTLIGNHCPVCLRTGSGWKLKNQKTNMAEKQKLTSLKAQRNGYVLNINKTLSALKSVLGSSLTKIIVDQIEVHDFPELKNVDMLLSRRIYRHWGRQNIVAWPVRGRLLLYIVWLGTRKWLVYLYYSGRLLFILFAFNLGCYLGSYCTVIHAYADIHWIIANSGVDNFALRSVTFIMTIFTWNISSRTTVNYTINQQQYEKTLKLLK